MPMTPSGSRVISTPIFQGGPMAPVHRSGAALPSKESKIWAARVTSRDRFRKDLAFFAGEKGAEFFLACEDFVGGFAQDQNDAPECRARPGRESGLRGGDCSLRILALA